MRPYSTFHWGEGVRWPASISARASSSARRRDVPGASTLARSSPSRRKGSPAQASARRAAASRPSVASDAVVGCSLISCMNAALERALHLSRKGDPANPDGGRRAFKYIGRQDGGGFPRGSDPQRGLNGRTSKARATSKRRRRVGASARRLAAQTPEDGKGVRGLNLVDQLAARLH